MNEYKNTQLYKPIQYTHSATYLLTRNALKPSLLFLLAYFSHAFIRWIVYFLTFSDVNATPHITTLESQSGNALPGRSCVRTVDRYSGRRVHGYQYIDCVCCLFSIHRRNQHAPRRPYSGGGDRGCWHRDGHGSILHHPTQPNTWCSRKDPTRPTNHSAIIPAKAIIFELNVANSKIQNDWYRISVTI